jgi:hypothetical protein
MCWSCDRLVKKIDSTGKMIIVWSRLVMDDRFHYDYFLTQTNPDEKSEIPGTDFYWLAKRFFLEKSYLPVWRMRTIISRENFRIYFPMKYRSWSQAFKLSWITYRVSKKRLAFEIHSIHNYSDPIVVNCVEFWSHRMQSNNS